MKIFLSKKTFRKICVKPTFHNGHLFGTRPKKKLISIDFKINSNRSYFFFLCEFKLTSLSFLFLEIKNDKRKKKETKFKRVQVLSTKKILGYT